MTTNHYLFEELAAFCPYWQKRYSTVRSAAEAAGILDLYYEYLATSDGRLYKLRMQGVPDTESANRNERRMRNRMLRRANVTEVNDDGE